ncbi:hypothetical protein DNTS_020777 [Danionella cerebrum]|uniref:Fibrinogen C-terminal domain-containing protein n=1 Tax=Danionella cerebrum TaxID=2873325 RepID=A0A553MPE5_9TELE|nr:hypothetical protein DNTS_020777 [Danionella translucida]
MDSCRVPSSMYLCAVLVFLLCVHVLCQRDILVAGLPHSSCTGSCSAMASTHKAHLDLKFGKTLESHKDTQVSDTSERLIQLQRCMLQHESVAVTQGEGSESLVAFLALMAAVLTECNLHCHSQRLREMATGLESVVGKNDEKDLLLLLKSITHSKPSNHFHHLQGFTLKTALCDMVTAGGGWTVFQRRFDGETNFNRTWQEYRDGFGSPQAEHWLGNSALYSLTMNGYHTLRITLQDWHEQMRHANYNNFKVAGETQRFRLTARDYHGDAGNAFSYSKQYNHDGRAFSTYDRDHDRYAAGNCARYYGAGWWFDSCLAANLNGRYYHGRYSGITDGIYWGTWYILTDYRSGERYSFKSVEMKTRPNRS